MAAICFSPLRARVARVIRLDECCNPVSGTGSQVVFTGFTSIDPSPDYEEGTEHVTRDATGNPCVVDKDESFLKRVDLDIEFCRFDPDLLVIMTGEQLLVSGAPITGTGVAFGEGLLTERFSLEIWQPLAGTACTVGGNPQFLWWAFPCVGQPMVDLGSIEDGPMTINVSGETRPHGAAWTADSRVAPYLGGNTLVDARHYLFNISDVAPPSPACGAV